MQPFLLEVTLIVSGGPVYRLVGNLHLMVWLQASNIAPSGGEAAGLVVRYDPKDKSLTTLPVEVPFAAAQNVAARLREFGLPGRTPQVEGVVDTSDTWCNISLHVRNLEQDGNFTLCLAHSGYEGDDAERFEQLLQSLLTAVGLDPREFQQLLYVNPSNI
ncbi:MAG TPA: hypothetical protein VGZ47_11080 [Gemmataceae bacterium]|jgi:hypothetical protein|nr:hypothetical protein [Gemmataceae bacterium]